MGRRLSVGGKGAGHLTSTVAQYIDRITSRFSHTFKFHIFKRLLKQHAANATNVFLPFAFSTSNTWALASLGSTPVGPRASLELLLRWSGQASLAEGRSEEKNVSRGRKTISSSALPTESLSVSEVATSNPVALEHAQQKGFYPQVGSLPLPESGLDGVQPLVAPPLVTEVPGTLLPARGRFDAPTPFASATLRHEALRDETDLAEEDLDQLADKLKRILDEEARRHGIQV
jgi:hypothetical protein